MPRKSVKLHCDNPEQFSDKPLSSQWFEAILIGDSETLRKFGLNQKQIAELRQLEHRSEAAKLLLTRDNTAARSVSKRVLAAQNGILPAKQVQQLSDKPAPAGTFYSRAPSVVAKAPVTLPAE